MATIRQINANRHNAHASTGPVTDEGKQASRANALKHGLAADELMLDDDRLIYEKRKIEWRANYILETPEQEWFFEQAVIGSVRLDRCREQEATIRQNEVQRATLCWDEDRRDEVEALAARLSKRPTTVSRQLGRTKQGVEWMIKRWIALGAILDKAGEWTEAQTSLALDLIGTALELRDVALPIENPAALVQREVAYLERRLVQSLNALDDFERKAAERGLPVAASKAITNLRRYENACMRQYLWALNRLQHRPYEPPQATAPQPKTPPQERTQCDSGQDAVDYSIPTFDRESEMAALARFEALVPPSTGQRAATVRR